MLQQKRCWHASCNGAQDTSASARSALQAHAPVNDAVAVQVYLLKHLERLCLQAVQDLLLAGGLGAAGC